MEDGQGWCSEDDRLAAPTGGMHVGCPAYGARKISKMLQKQGEAHAARCRVSRPMGLMGIRPCCPLPSLSAPARESQRFPYLLKGRSILFPDQAWPADITYVQIGGKHMHLAAVIDWFSRCMVSWRLSDTMRTQEVAACAEQAFREHGTPSAMSSDQGSVFGSEEYVSLLASRGIAQSMDGRARWRDNVLMEGLCAQAHNDSARALSPLLALRDIGLTTFPSPHADAQSPVM